MYRDLVGSNVWSRGSRYLQDQKMVLILAIFLLWSFTLLPQGPSKLLSYTQSDGLSNNYVLSMCQDQAGFMWIGTENGLNRFDGHHFLSFRFDPDDSTSISNNWILNIHEDQKGHLWVGTQNGLNRLDRDQGNFERVQLADPNDQDQNLEISSLYEDYTGALWAIVGGNNLMKVHYAQDQGAHILKREDPIQSQDEAIGGIRDILQDQSGDFWLRLQTGLARWQPPSDQLEVFPLPERLQFLDLDRVQGRTLLDRTGKIIVLGNDGILYQLSPLDRSPSIKPLFSHQEFISAGLLQAGEKFFHMAFGQENYLWIASQTKAMRIDLGADTISRENVMILTLPFDVHAFLSDVQDMLWVGTAGGGVHILQETPSPFSFFQHNPEDPKSLSPGIVRTFTETADGILWVGLLGSGIDQLERTTGLGLQKKGNLKAAQHSTTTKRGNLIIKILRSSQQELWIATNASGLKRFNLETKSWTTYNHNPNDPNSISQDRIWGLAEDPQGYIWVGAFQEGLNRLDPKTDSVKRFIHHPADSSSLLDNQVKSLYTDTSGDIWIGSHAGLSRYDQQTKSFQHFMHDPLNPASISSGIVWCIYEDHGGDLWIGTGLGLNRFDRERETFEHFFEKDGLPSNTVYGLLQDQDQNLWVSTDDGLALLLATDPKNTFRAIHQKDGLAFTSFVPKAYYSSQQSGHLYFGSTQGIVIVDPQLLSKEQRHPKLTLHSFSKNNLQSKEGGLITDYFIGQKSKEISLTHLDQSVSFAFTDLIWKKNKAFTYEYQLIGLNQRWMPLDNKLEVTFTNLNPGRYQLKLRAKDFYGQTQAEAQMLSLKVYPPWWRSSWAYSLYVIILILLLLMLYRLQLRRQLEKQEAASLRRLDRFKNRLYANITHEFRTPLTIIGGMTEQIRKEPDRWLEKGTRMISDNNANLLNLVDQMLELQKVESGGLTINYQLGDIIPFLRSIYEQFEGFAQSGKQTMTFHAEMASLEIDYDTEKITRIVSNLLSNAIKYTPAGGKISLTISTTRAPESLQLTVADTGMGIPEDQLPHVFDRFFQASNNENASRVGSGIGLSLTRELIKLMGGEIKVNSIEGSGSTFVISIPITRSAAPQALTGLAQLQPAIIGKQGLSEPMPPPANATLPIALIVEDNPNIAEYISICLQKDYQLLLASDGQEGIDLAIEQIPDIIISDVMMPKKNGFELCNYLKEDQRTSHIPIILLTAKADVESRITGLQQGADDYLAKPFHEEELLVRMQNLLIIRQKLQARYQDLYGQPLPSFLESQENVPAKEDAFILKLQETFEARIDDPDFDALALSQELHLSRSQLGRKVKALTGRSLSVYLRSLRLQKAKSLLQSSDLSIKEIAYEVGFPTPNYFSTSYIDEFGETPTDTREIG